MVSCHLDWTGREIDKFRLWLFGAVAGYWLGGQSSVSTADTSFLNASMGLLSTLTFRCTAREAVPFIKFDIKGECKEWLPNWSASSGMFDARGTGGRVLALHAGLLIDAGVVMPSSFEVVMEVSALLTEHVRPASDLAVVERNHESSLTELA